MRQRPYRRSKALSSCPDESEVLVLSRRRVLTTRDSDDTVNHNRPKPVIAAGSASLRAARGGDSFNAGSMCLVLCVLYIDWQSPRAGDEGRLCGLPYDSRDT